MEKWMLRVKAHPYVTDGDKFFDKLLQLETFIGHNDIQLDHIVKIDRTYLGKVTTYKVIDLIPISHLRVVLERTHADIKM